MEIFFNANLIEAETQRAILIKMPKKEHYFWMPKKLVSFKGSKGAWLKLWIPDNFKVTIKTKKGNYLKELSADELYDRVKEMSDQIEGNLEYGKRKKIDKFIKKQVKMENPVAKIDESLKD